MSFSAGSICQFNCCQEGRDLPDDNKIKHVNSKISYTCGCPYHYFLIISTYNENIKPHSDWSKILSVNNPNNKPQEIKLCTAILLDEKNPNGEDNLNPLLYFLKDEDYIEGNQRERDRFVMLRNNHNALVCDRMV